MKNLLQRIFPAKKEPIKNVYVGCGDDHKEGYIGCDIRKTKNAQIVCKAWELSKKIKNLSNIYSRHMIEHLTFPELEMTLADWYKALGPGGKVHIICPNMDFHIQQFQNAIINKVNYNDKKSDFRWSLAGFWGWQREDYTKNVPNKYWDIHKSGYNCKILHFFLSRARFTNINCYIVDNCHLVAEAYKPAQKNFSFSSGERQIAPTLGGIRRDHIVRYQLIIDFIKTYTTSSKLKGLDVFCGNGYGSYLLSKNLDITSLLSIDGSNEAIEFAKIHYQNENIEYKCQLFPFKLEKNKYDFVASMESIEHVEDDETFLKEISGSLVKGGVLFLSTPNADKLDLKLNPSFYHLHHYRPNELKKWFKKHGLNIITFYGQDVYILDANGTYDPASMGLVNEDNMFLKEKYEGQFCTYILQKV